MKEPGFWTVNPRAGRTEWNDPHDKWEAGIEMDAITRAQRLVEIAELEAEIADPKTSDEDRAVAEHELKMLTYNPRGK